MTTQTRIAIVGTAGQVGSNLLAELSKDPTIRVWGVCRNRFSAALVSRPGLDVRVGTITEGSAAKELLGDAEVIVNCAAAGGLPGTARQADESVIDALLSLPGNKRILHFSSVAVHGMCCDRSRTTFERPSPDWSYGSDKLHLERVVLRRARRTSHGVVVLRLGHVYGVGQWVSRFLLTFAAAGRLLPFDGALPSNAVHVKNVVSAVRSIVGRGTREGTFNLFDPGNATWREVTDWNTRAAGLPPVGALDVVQSEGFARRFRNSLWSHIGREVGALVRGLPAHVLARVPSVKQLALSALAASKSPALERFAMRNVLRISATPTQELDYTERYLFSEGAPGPIVPYTANVSADDALELRQWWHGLSSFDALLPTSPGPTEDRERGALHEAAEL